MTSFGAAHLAALALLALTAVLAVRWARAADPDLRDRTLRTAGWILLAIALAAFVWALTPAAWDLSESLPLHYSDLLRIATPLALITRARWAVALSVYGGLTLNLQSVLTPDLRYLSWPPLDYALYWTAHGAALVVPIVLLAALGVRPTWRLYGTALAGTAVWALVAATGNALTGANYGYLAHAPAGPSLLDLMGPWPVYLVVEAGVIAGVWALMTLPAVLAARRAGPVCAPGTNPEYCP